MGFLSHGDIGKGLGGTAGQIARQVGSWVCGQYRANPNNWLITQFGRGFLDQTCPRDYQTPAPDRSIPFPGGQCPVYYTATWGPGTARVIRGDGSVWQDPYPMREISLTRNLGPIQGVGGEIITRSGPQELYQAFVIAAGGVKRTVSVTGWLPVGFRILNVSYALKSLIREDGLPDSCGNPPGQYSPPRQTLPTQVNSNVTINSDDDNYSFSVPFFYVPVNNQFQFPIKVDVGGVKVNFNIDGVEVDFGNEGVPANPSLPPGIEDLPDKVEDINNKTDDIIDKIDNLPKFEDPIYDPDDFDSIEEDEEPTEVEDKEIDEEISFVIIKVVRLPYKEKVITVNTTQDLIVFAGYFYWKVGESRLPAEPIRFVDNVFFPPKFVSGYGYYSLNGSTLSASSYTKKIQDLGA